ncbi:MAG: hypothetical protein J2P36_38635, partial [Ktedonobacteraceae bacterium]|nr:hypothetical protein [Ktedonobacteraceae bacterium]
MTSAKKRLLLCLLGLASLFWSACGDTTMPTSISSAGASPTAASQPSVSLQMTGLVKRSGVMQL